MQQLKDFWMKLETLPKIGLLLGISLVAACSLCLCLFIVIPTPETGDVAETIDSDDTTEKATVESALILPTDTPIPLSPTPIPPSSTPVPPAITSTPDLVSLAIQAVADNLPSNNLLDIQVEDLKGMENPNGEGIFVYVEETRFSGVERFILWLVIDGIPYPVNGATKDVTPDLPWPREAAEGVWDRTGLSPYSATEAIEIVFGPQ